MTGERVCFNPDLLAGTDDASFAYQEAVDRLTDGFIPDEFDPCLEADQVPASFVINGFNPEDTDEIREYVKYKPYYQTRAALATRRPRTGQNDLPYPPEPDGVSLSQWENDPLGAIRRVAALPDRLLGAATFASLLVTTPQTDRTLAAMDAYLGQDADRFDRIYPAADFSLVETYRLAKGRDLKFKIAVDLLERFEDRYLIHVDPSFVSDPTMALWQEWITELVPIFIELHQSASDRDVQKRFANALVRIGDDRALRYVTSKVMEGRSTVNYDAFGALLDSGYRTEVAGYLGEILEGAPLGKVHESTAWHRTLSAVAANRVGRHWRLARAVSQSIAAGSPGWGTTLRDQIRYIAEASANPVADLLPIVMKTREDFNTDEARTLAFWELAATNTPAAQNEVKKIIRDLDRFTASSDMSELLKNNLRRALVQNSGQAAHETVLELLDELKDRPDLRRLLTYELGSFDNSSDSVTAFRFFKKASELSRDPDVSVAREAVGARQRLAKRNFVELSSRLKDMTPEEQMVFVENADMDFMGLDVPRSYYLLKDDTTLTPEAWARIEERALDFLTDKILGADYAPEPYLSRLEYTDAFKNRLLTRIAKAGDGKNGKDGEKGLRLIKDIVNDQTLPIRIRRQAVLALGGRSGINKPAVEEVLVSDYILNDKLPEEVRLAGIDALKERARQGIWKENVRQALARLLPIPASISTRAGAVLKGLK